MVPGQKENKVRILFPFSIIISPRHKGEPFQVILDAKPVGCDSWAPWSHRRAGDVLAQRVTGMHHSLLQVVISPEMG